MELSSLSCGFRVGPFRCGKPRALVRHALRRDGGFDALSGDRLVFEPRREILAGGARYGGFFRFALEDVDEVFGIVSETFEEGVRLQPVAFL